MNRKDWAELKTDWMVDGRGRVELRASIPPHRLDLWRPLRCRDPYRTASYDDTARCTQRGTDLRWRVTSLTTAEEEAGDKTLAMACKCGAHRKAEVVDLKSLRRVIRVMSEYQSKKAA